VPKATPLRPNAWLRRTIDLRGATHLHLTLWCLILCTSPAKGAISVVLRPDASALERLAAEELASYLSRMGNARPAIVPPPPRVGLFTWAYCRPTSTWHHAIM
jgi:hypothetical protein